VKSEQLLFYMSTNLAWTSPLCGHRHSNSYHICLRTCPTSSFSLLSDFDNFHNSTGLWTWRHISVLSGGISAKLAEIFNMWGVGIAAKIFYVMGQRSGSGGNGHRNLRTRYSWTPDRIRTRTHTNTCSMGNEMIKASTWLVRRSKSQKR